MFGVILFAVFAAALLVGGAIPARRRDLLPVEGPDSPASRRRVSLLTEVVAYIGAVLVLAGGGVAIVEEWNHFSPWGHVSIFASTALFFFAVGFFIWQVSEPAVQRVISAVWCPPPPPPPPAAGFAAHEGFDARGAVTTLSTGIAATAYAGVLWLARRRELLMLALFAGLIVTVCGVVLTADGRTAPALAFALSLWGLGLGWSILVWQYPEPLWTTFPLGSALALIAPSLAVWDHGWLYAVGVVTAAAAMAASVPLRDIVLLAFGTIALSGYVAATVVQYLRNALGTPATLVITGVALLAIALVTARLRRATRLTEEEEDEEDLAGFEGSGREPPAMRLPKAS